MKKKNNDALLAHACVNASRGQAVAIDFFLAVVIFASLFLAIDEFDLSLKHPKDSLDSATLSAITASDRLLEGPGVPLGWNETTVKLIGIAPSRKIVGATQLESLLNTTVANASNLLGLDEYNFSISLDYNNATMARALNVSSGSQIDVWVNTTGTIASANLSARASSLCMYNNLPCRLNVTVWKS